MHIDQKKL